jgi:NHLM bacteriocin system ABC transporter ATP-binding protein
MSSNEKIYIGVENPFILNESDKFWIVLSGEVNVFYTKINNNGEYLNPLTHLYSLKKGEMLFSLLPKEIEDDTRLIVSSNQATLMCIYKENLLDIDHFFLKNMVNKWVSNTASKLNLHNSPRVYTAIDDYSVTYLDKNIVAFPSNGVNWVQLQKGMLEVFSGGTEISYDKYPFLILPTTNKLWIKTLEESEIKVLSTSEVLKEDEIYFLLALSILEEYFYSTLNKKIENQKNDEEKHFLEKIQLEDQGFSHTLDKIKSVVSGKKINISTNNPTKINNNVLFTTCQLIGNEIGFDLEPPKHLDTYENNISNQLYAIAKSSKLRIRKIILRDVWWKDENGHLLAFTKKDKTPVALIQKSPTSYCIKNVSDGTETIVTNDIASTLEPIAYMFLAGFDGKMDSIKKVFSFAIKGVEKDAKTLIFAALIGSLIGLLVPVLSGMMYDDVIPAADRSLHLEVFVIMIMIGIVTACLQLIQGVLQLRLESKSSINLQAGVMDHLLRLPVTFYKKYSTGDLTNRVLSINAIRQIISSTLMTAILSGAFSFVNLFLLFYYDSKLAWVGVAMGLIAAGFMISIGFIKLKYDRQVSTYQGDIQGFLFEFLSGITKIRITGGEKRVFTLWANKFSKLKQLGFISGTYQNFVETFIATYPLLTRIFFFAFIYYSIVNSDGSNTLMSVGAFMAFISAFNQFLNDSLRLSMALITSLNVVTLYERVKPILEEETESAEQSVDPGEFSGEIEMNSISFRYKEDLPLVLNDVTFKVKPGEMIAFVGASGSGKSTIMRLLLGFEQAETGSIYYDGDSFESMNKELVRRQIGVVLQNGALMSGSIYQNIVGNSELTLDDAWEAARMAGMEEDIKQMPMEMHTVVSEGAGTFSGGQRQRLMIARAIVHKPRLLFMDEATSALDNKTQNIVSESLDKLQATRIIIAHRLSTIKNADRIFVLDKGTIAESGTYEELMKQEALFSELAKRQIA